MNIQEEIKVEITPEELKQIIKDHLTTKGINVDPKNIYFEASDHDQEGDWRAEYAQIPTFDGVRCTGNKI